MVVGSNDFCEPGPDRTGDTPLKRILLEWGTLLSAGLSLSLLALWAASVASDQVQGYTYVPNVLNVPNGPDARDDLHLVVGRGALSFCNHVMPTPSGGFEPWVMNPRVVQTPKVRRYRQCTVPGFDFRFGQSASDGSIDWSLSLSLLIPAALFLVGAALTHRRLRAWRGPTGRGPAGRASTFRGRA